MTRSKKRSRLIREGMEQGAVGLATGMSYFPNAWSDTDELVELVQGCRGVWRRLCHTPAGREHGARLSAGGDVPEALEIGRRSGVKVHFSHYRTQPDNAGQVAERVRLIDEAKAEGVDCTLELYPYPDWKQLSDTVSCPARSMTEVRKRLLERLRDPCRATTNAGIYAGEAERSVLGSLYLFA